MHPFFPRLALALLAVAGFQADAAETYHNCTGVINSVPATIGTQGTWCLRTDLSTAIASGAAITIATNNVTVDCNGFKLGGLAAGPQTQTTGIRSANRQNITVRNCSVRGFRIGMDLDEGAGHLVEDNRLDNNLHIGIRVSAYSGMVRRNLVYDTGGGVATIQLRVREDSIASNSASTAGIAASNSPLLDNVVDGMFGAQGGTYSLIGIFGAGPGLPARHNVVRGLATTATSGNSIGIGFAGGHGALIESNVVSRVGTAPAGQIGIVSTDTARCAGNSIYNFSTPFLGCTQP